MQGCGLANLEPSWEASDINERTHDTDSLPASNLPLEKLPLCLKNCTEGPEGKLIQAVLDDFLDALVAYEHISGPAMTDGRWAVVLGIDADARAADAQQTFDAAMLSNLSQETNGCARGVFGVALTAAWETKPAEDALAQAAACCTKAGHLWQGGLAVAGSTLLAKKIAGPRMGFWRRPCSEGTDRLITALRLGSSVSHAAEVFGWTDANAVVAGRNLILAHCPLPYVLYKHLS